MHLGQVTRQRMKPFCGDRGEQPGPVAEVVFGRGVRKAGTSGDGSQADRGATMLDEFRARGSQQSLAYLRAGGGCHAHILTYFS